MSIKSQEKTKQGTLTTLCFLEELHSSRQILVSSLGAVKYHCEFSVFDFEVDFTSHSHVKFKQKRSSILCLYPTIYDWKLLFLG